MSLLEVGDSILLLHNPRCSKSRAAHALLTDRGVAFEERRYLEQPLSREELDELRARLGRAPSEWLRRGEAAYREAGLSEASSDADRLDAIAKHPILMERPIALRGRRAVVGRPPENVLELL